MKGSNAASRSVYCISGLLTNVWINQTWTKAKKCFSLVPFQKYGITSCCLYCGAYKVSRCHRSRIVIYVISNCSTIGVSHSWQRCNFAKDEKKEYSLSLQIQNQRLGIPALLISSFFEGSLGSTRSYKYRALEQIALIYCIDMFGKQSEEEGRHGFPHILASNPAGSDIVLFEPSNFYFWRYLSCQLLYVDRLLLYYN